MANIRSISVVVEGHQFAYLQVLRDSVGMKNDFELTVCFDEMVTRRERQFSSFNIGSLDTDFFFFLFLSKRDLCAISQRFASN